MARISQSTFVLKALALGATAVPFGRLILWGSPSKSRRFGTSPASRAPQNRRSPAKAAASSWEVVARVLASTPGINTGAVVSSGKKEKGA